ncbi:MAG: hypothetical protein MI754_03410 [Chromatiales bacterium]|nr:hypothetical protein [Chromatiales bacterium]
MNIHKGGTVGSQYLLSVARLLLVIGSGLFLSFAAQAETITPSHVYQASQQLINDIKLIREHSNVTTSAKVPGLQTHKLPLHAYTKSLEVRAKVGRLQKKHNLPAITAAEIPLKKLTPGDVLESIEVLLAETDKIKQALNINQLAPSVPFEPGKTSSNVYENLWAASYLLDDLVGPINPNLVFRNVQYALNEVAIIANKLNIALPDKPPARQSDIKPKHPNIAGFKNLYRIARVERKLDIAPVRVSNFPEGKIAPADVYDTTNNILAELIRLKVHMGATAQRSSLPVPENKKPADVLMQMQLLGSCLETLEQNI